MLQMHPSLLGKEISVLKNNRKSIKKKQYIRSFITVFYKCPLICYNKRIIIRILIINKIYKTGAFLSLYKIAYFNTMLNISINTAFF